MISGRSSNEGAIRLEEEQQHRQPLIQGTSSSSNAANTITSLWNQLNYVAQDLVSLLVIWILYLVCLVFMNLFNMNNIIFLGEKLTLWLKIATLIALWYIIVSLTMHVALDIVGYFYRKKRGFIFRFFHQSVDIIVLLFLFMGCIFIHDYYFHAPCDNLPISDPDNPDSPYPIPNQCYFRFIRRILICSMLTCLGFLLVKWVVLVISLRYQDKVYRDRIIRNRYQLYIANLLYEGCVEQGTKCGIDPKRMSVIDHHISHLDQDGSIHDSESVDEDQEDVDEEFAIVAPRPEVMTSSGWVKRLVSWFKKKTPGGRLFRTSERRSRPVVLGEKLKNILDFNSFKKSIKIFKSDFTLYETSYGQLSNTDAKNRAKFIFKVLHTTSGSPTRDYLSREDFQRVFKSSQIAMDAFEIFDINFDGILSKTEIKHVFAHIYREHAHLSQSITSSAEALKALDAMFSVLSFIVLGLLYMAIFGINVQSILTLSLSLIIGLNVIIGNFSRDVFDSLMFLFVSHPFDIGDRVKIEGDSKIYTVKQITVLRTEFHDGKGEEVYMPNPVLLRKNIINLRRSQEQWESIELCLDLSTTEEQLNEFRACLTKYLHENPQYFYHKFDMELCGQHTNLEVYPVRFRAQCKPSYDNIRKAERHREIMAFMKSTLEKLGISYYPKGPDGPRVVVTPPRRFMTESDHKPIKHLIKAKQVSPKVYKPKKDGRESDRSSEQLSESEASEAEKASSDMISKDLM